jgi:hypothetical protein
MGAKYDDRIRELAEKIEALVKEVWFKHLKIPDEQQKLAPGLID